MLYRPSNCSTDHSKMVHLWQSFFVRWSVVSYMTFVLQLCVSHLSICRASGRQWFMTDAFPGSILLYFSIFVISFLWCSEKIVYIQCVYIFSFPFWAYIANIPTTWESCGLSVWCLSWVISLFYFLGTSGTYQYVRFVCRRSFRVWVCSTEKRGKYKENIWLGEALEHSLRYRQS